MGHGDEGLLQLEPQGEDPECQLQGGQEGQSEGKATQASRNAGQEMGQESWQEQGGEGHPGS
jgi:hypothetical protein